MMCRPAPTEARSVYAASRKNAKTSAVECKSLYSNANWIPPNGQLSNCDCSTFTTRERTAFDFITWVQTGTETLSTTGSSLRSILMSSSSDGARANPKCPCLVLEVRDAVSRCCCIHPLSRQPFELSPVPTRGGISRNPGRISPLLQNLQ